MNPLMKIMDSRPLATPTIHPPEKSNDFQRIHQPGGARDNDQCSIISNDETAIELTDTECILTPGGMEFDDQEGFSPRDRTKHSWSPTTGRTDNLDEILIELEGLKKEFAKESESLKNRITNCENEGQIRPQRTAIERDEYLNYLRKWMENVVTSVCADHPHVTDIEVLLRDLRERLTRMIGTGELDEIDEQELLKIMQPKGSSPRSNVMSPMSPSMAHSKFANDDETAKKTSCCTIS
eukprot:TRINITY_DN16307_c0_g1_i1.p1 TRINITY_DN16307_c0_g1~~TRINITY_DN16307_c0_g1_i1.p1  ORF type:complete len:247 (+),score=35.04 TRINITY_DN16307_c0_g1_i1:29-742(+)